MNHSLLHINNPGVQLTSLTVSGRDLHARLFNAESEGEQIEISFAMQPKTVDLVELDGRVSQVVTASPLTGSRQRIQIRIPRFGIRTLRFSDVA